MIFTEDDVKVIIRHPDGTETLVTEFANGEPIRISKDDNPKECETLRDSVEESCEVVSKLD